MSSFPNRCAQKRFLEPSMPAMSSNIDKLFEAPTTVYAEAIKPRADVGRLLCLYATWMPFWKAVPALLHWQDVMSAGGAGVLDPSKLGLVESLAAQHEEVQLSLGHR